VSAKANALGEFLRARRDQVRPEDVGLVPGGQRRAPGLRREECSPASAPSTTYDSNGDAPKTLRHRFLMPSRGP